MPSLVMPMLRHPRSLSLAMPRLRHPRSLFHDMPRFCHPRSQYQAMPRLRYPRSLSLVLSQHGARKCSDSWYHITAITLYCRLLYRTAMFVNQKWACSSLMTNIQKSWNLSQYSNINQQWYIIIWTHYTSVIIYFVQLFIFKKGGSVMV